MNKNLQTISNINTLTDIFFNKQNYDKNIIQIKKIYLEHLINILSPIMFDSIKNIYNHSVQLSKDSKNTFTVEFAFKQCLKDLNILSKQSIMDEVNKIKNLSNSNNYFDNLIKGVIKSHIILLSYNTTKSDCPICDPKYYNVNIENFIQKCYIELGNIIFNNPNIFIKCILEGNNLNNINNINNINNNKFDKCVKKAITKTVLSFIPINEILLEYVNKPKINDEMIKEKQRLEREQLINDISEEITNKTLIGISNINNTINKNMNEIIQQLQIINNNITLKPNEINNFQIEKPNDNPILVNVNDKITSTTQNIDNVMIKSEEKEIKDIENLMDNNDLKIDLDKLDSKKEENNENKNIQENNEEDKQNEDKQDEDNELNNELNEMFELDKQNNNEINNDKINNNQEFINKQENINNEKNNIEEFINKQESINNQINQEELVNKQEEIINNKENKVPILAKSSGGGQDEPNNNNELNNIINSIEKVNEEVISLKDDSIKLNDIPKTNSTKQKGGKRGRPPKLHKFEE